MIDRVYFKNYKSFKYEQELQLKPVTILIGKNNAGKTAVLKLLSLIEGSLSGDFSEPISYEYRGVKLGDDYRDLYYKRQGNSELEIKIEGMHNTFLEFKVTLNNSHTSNPTPQITYWANNDVLLKYNYQKSRHLKAYFFDEELSGNSYPLQFKGVKITSKLNTKIDVSSFKIDTSYIGPLRMSSEQIRYFTLPSNRNIKNINSSGIEACYLLIIEAMKNTSFLLKELNAWYVKNFNGWIINPIKDNAPFEIHLSRENPEYFSINLADVGQGITQSLPVIVSAFLPNEHSITLIEQPELHLHPSAHGNLAELFADTAIKHNKKYLIETHSQNFVLRLRRLVAEKKMNKNDLAIYWVAYDEEKNTSSLKKIEVDDLGRVDFWPENVFSETLDETIAIRSAQLKAKKNGN